MFFAFMNLMKIGPYFLLGQFSLRNFATSMALLPLAVAANFHRHLAGAPDADRAVLPHHLSADVLHLAGADLAGCGRLCGIDRRRIFSLGCKPPARQGTEREAMATPYDTGLDRNAANFQPLTPLSFLARAAAVYPDQTAIIHGERSWTYREFFARARRLASALARRGIKRGDTVAVVLPNVPAMLEAHYGVAMAGAVLNSINTRLDAAIIALHPRPRRSQGADRRPRVLQGGEGRVGALQGEAAGDRLRRSGIQRLRRTDRQTRIRGFPARRRCRVSPG